MKQVKAYQSEDGQIFRNVHEAAARDAKLELEKWADEHSVCRGGEWSQDMVLECLLEHAETVRSILTRYSARVPANAEGSAGD